jgi:RNA polymerase sigma-70 factor (ECF subfamily)
LGISTSRAHDALPNEDVALGVVPEQIAGRTTADILRALGGADAEQAREALSATYETYFDRLWRFAYRRTGVADVAKEIVHDVFLALWGRRDTVTITGDLGVYLYGAVRNRAYKAHRHTAVVTRLETAVERNTIEPPAVGQVAGPEQLLDESEAERLLRELLASVPARDRDVLTLRWFHSMTYGAIAESLGVSVSQVRTILARNEAQLLAVFGRARG